MGRRTFSGREVVTVLVNAGDFEWRRTAGDHAQLYYEHPTNDDDRRHVTVPLHDELRIGTLREIADEAGARDFDAFCDWIDGNASVLERASQNASYDVFSITSYLNLLLEPANLIDQNLFPCASYILHKSLKGDLIRNRSASRK